MDIVFKNINFKLNNVPQNTLFDKFMNENDYKILILTDTKFELGSVKAIVDYINEGIVPTFTKDIIELADYLMFDTLLKEIGNIPEIKSIDNKYDIRSLCKNGYIEVVKLLENQDWDLALEGACINGNLYLVMHILMVSKGAIRWNKGLRGACKGGNLELAKFMIENGANNYIDSLESACEGGHFELAKLLIEKCKLYCDDKLWKYCSLKYACKSGRLELVELIIQKGADNWNVGLWGACEGGHLDLVKLMIHKGADAWDAGLWGACQEGHLDLVELMIQKGANDWNTGLYCACYSGHLELIELMISKGANNWNDGLWCASIGGHLNIIESMIEKGANNFNDGLRCAYNGGHIEIAKLMIQKGAKSNCTIINNIIKYEENYKIFINYSIKKQFKISDCLRDKIIECIID